MKLRNSHKFVFLLLLLLLFFPNESYTGAKNGILLWFNTVIPALLPFLIVSNLICLLDLCPFLCDLLYPVFKFLFKVPKPACYPILIGLISGYPIGAKACAECVRSGKLSVEEGQYLLSFICNASPTFILCYLGINCLHMPKHIYAFYFIILLSSYFCSIVFRKHCQYHSKITTGIFPKKIPIRNNYSFLEALNHSFIDAFKTIGIIGGFVLICSILQTFLNNVTGFFSPICSFLSWQMEFTTGLSGICAKNFSQHTKIILTLPTVAFGGLSSLLQTHSVIAGSGLSIQNYIYAKLCQSVFVTILTACYLIFIT